MNKTDGKSTLAIQTAGLYDYLKKDPIERLGLVNIYPKSYNEREFGINLLESSDDSKENGAIVCDEGIIALGKIKEDRFSEYLKKSRICKKCHKPKSLGDPRGITFIGEFPYCKCDYTGEKKNTIYIG